MSSKLFVFALCCACLPRAFALDPHKSLTQYSRATWTQQEGLPQDSVRAITQTAAGYLWLGTDEGLARYDGYEFTVFDKAGGSLPANSIASLAAGKDGSLWIGTTEGLTRYHNGRFRTYTTRDGLPDNAIGDLLVDHAGTLWIVAGVTLSRFENGRFVNLKPGVQVPVAPVRAICEDPHDNIWVAGYGGLVKLRAGVPTVVLPGTVFEGNIITSMMADRHDRVWVGGSQGVLEVSAAGVRRYGLREGLPDVFIRKLKEDRDGNIWAGGNGGLARLEGRRFVIPSDDAARGHDVVQDLFEDREGDLWLGGGNGLVRLRDDLFTVYGKSEGLPSDEPNTVYQDHSGRIWVGFHDMGLMLFSPDRRVFTARDGIPATDIFSIRETRTGDLLVSTRLGLARENRGRFSLYSPREPLNRQSVFDALEDSAGRLWIAAPAGLFELRNGRARMVAPGGPLFSNYVVTLLEGKDGVLWAGAFGKGLWRVSGPPDREQTRLFTTADGLSSDQIRSLSEDADGTLWIGTFGGGLDALRNGRITRYTRQDGLLSDNIAKVEDDGESLWLSTTRGLCRVSKQCLRAFAAGKRKSLDVVNYDVDDGLRSAQCVPAPPVASGGERTSDGRLWFTTSRGLAVAGEPFPRRVAPPPLVRLVSMASDGQPVDLSGPARLAPGNGRIQIRYTGIHLSAPEQVKYSYRLLGLDTDWVRAGNRRFAIYNSLGHGWYRFELRAEAPGSEPAVTSFAFELLPHFYETWWFRLACACLLAAAIWGAYELRLRSIGNRFAFVLEERARLAREIHDTLAQGFVGISSQLDAVAMCMPEGNTPARKYLDIARGMARHSLTEARRSIMDLRAAILDEHDLGAALQSGARRWTAGSGLSVDVAVKGKPAVLPQETEQHLLRIAQEAVSNVVKHAEARKIRIELATEDGRISLRIVDDGRGFEQKDVFYSLDGHFGLIGMRERAERIGGEIRLVSRPGEGTEVEVTASLP